jgi:site-specific recombinase XerD
MTAKNRGRLRQFTDEQNVRRLVGLPSKVLSTLDTTGPKVTDAVRVQEALAVALLLVAPVRVKNLASIDIERHIHRVSKASCSLVFPEMEVKNHQDLEYPLSSTVLQLLDLYLEVYRPLLAKKRGSKLFVSLNGNEKAPAFLSAQIPKFIKNELGLEMNLHLFRHFAGFVFLKSHPGEYETVRQLLGHKSIKTTVEFYTGLEHVESFRRYDEILDSYREETSYGDS